MNDEQYEAYLRSIWGAYSAVDIDDLIYYIIKKNKPEA